MTPPRRKFFDPTTVLLCIDILVALNIINLLQSGHLQASKGQPWSQIVPVSFQFFYQNNDLHESPSYSLTVVGMAAHG
jgi:hypothetical protein